MGWIGGGALTATLGVVVVLGALWLWQDRLIYFPDRTRPDPARAGLQGLEVLTLPTADGLTLLGWWLPPADPRQPVLLYLHGNGGNLGDRAPRLHAIQALGWGVLMVEWRGYGGNPGRPSEAGLVLDARAGLAALAERGVATAQRVLWGESLGTGVAVRLVAEQPDAAAAILLESPYTSLLDLAALHYPMLPARWLLRDRYDSGARIGAIRLPILIMVGALDRVVPASMGRRLAADAPRAELWEAPAGGHDDLRAHGMLDAAAAFLERHLPAP